MIRNDAIRVLIVDDSAVVRNVLRTALNDHPRIQVVAEAADPYAAREVLESRPVDVVTLDIEMPRMDGLTFLKYLMKYRPLPVIMVSSLTDRSSHASLQALSLGAVDVTLKPDAGEGLEGMAESLIEKILSCADIDPERLKALNVADERTAKRTEPKKFIPTALSRKIIAIGASTGGPQSLEILLKGFPAHFPPTLVAIHLPERFTKSYADRLDTIVPMRAKEAEDGELLVDGTIYVAPGNHHMTIRAIGADRRIRLSSGPKVFHQRPSVDVLFESVAEQDGLNSLGILLTGMGKDGAKGLLAIKNSGGFTVAQDEASCVVFGMPKEAIALGAAEEVIALDRIAERLRRKLL